LDRKFINQELVYECQSGNYPGAELLTLPVADEKLFNRDNENSERSGDLVFFDKYTGPVLEQTAKAIDISKIEKKSNLNLANLFKKSKVLYLYEWSSMVVNARLCGCPVVFIPNAQCLARKPTAFEFYGNSGLAWGLDLVQLEHAKRTVVDFKNEYDNVIADWQLHLSKFIQTTQELAHLSDRDIVWPQLAVDALPNIYTEPKDMAACADRLKWHRLNEQYKLWSARSTLREIDAQIYAELAVNKKLPTLSVLIDHRDASSDALADTLDSLMAALGQSAQVIIVSHDAVPDIFAHSDALSWIQVADEPLESTRLGFVSSAWLLLIQSGTVLAPQALMEWAWASTYTPRARLIYADEDIRLADGTGIYPFFKPDPNIELLRCTNYLGSVVLVQAKSWLTSGLPLFDGGLYAYALTLLGQFGKSSLAHIDTILFHAQSQMTTTLENQEFELARAVLMRNAWTKELRPLERWGTWLVEYSPLENSRVSIVIPTGLQTGYLRSLLEALRRYPEPALIDIVLVCPSKQIDEVRYVIADLAADLVQIVSTEQDSYNHSAALNEGIRYAKGDFILVVDDDTEPLHKNWLSLLLGVLAQDDVGCVAPRLVASKDKDTQLVGGPLVLGINGAVGAYVGEQQRLDETGVYSRLQLSQDVSAVSGHFFLFRKTDWTAVGRFDEQTFGLHFTVLDFCLRLNLLGKRHVWTPLVGVLHQGGKTVAALRRDVRHQVSLAEREIQEREQLLSRWAIQLANDPNYNRHLSLSRPFDIESVIVIDWQPKRHDRPRALAMPVQSGSGQYRVIEPLNALQDAGLAQSCVVMPISRGQQRALQPLEVVRAAPDRLILQHSVDDGQLRQIEHYKLASPDLKIVQMVDDLFGEVPEKHPNRQFQSREGHQRMMQALTQSDRLIVTTQPLVDYYKRYVSDVRIVPNALGNQWLSFVGVPNRRSRLRVGWVGAGQHQGDLEIIADVVRELSNEVDWVFMGMCTDGIKPYLKEFHGFVSIADYPKKMFELDLDIAIAPLEDNIFNRCKSNLRLLEYGAMGWPVVCSDVHPYRTDDPPVIRVKNSSADWIGAIRSLMDENVRRNYASKLNKWVCDKYILSEKIEAWFGTVFL
jgi:hypothetical protein